LDELADLADGDLTTTATVTEDFTGAIADSINFTIDQLRILVARINETAVNVSAAAQETQQTALHLAEASEHQAQEIAGASAAVNEMAVTIDQVSANASESAAVAERAVSIATNGAKVVQNTIHGMDTIREQIQDTSKRIKRLGESSQEIGDIVSLINDIADQTNILALNAAIQASMAGDAGRGFAVVADEVQRLAERSAAATKQIEALVKTIQNDTNEAVISMEQTTSEVVRGARLAQDAGVALEEIETVSNNLAELIQNISNAARQQASSAGHISNTMNVIQEITTQTSAGTGATAQSIGNLAEMAMDLRESVAGFKLPEEEVAHDGVGPVAHTVTTEDVELEEQSIDYDTLPEDFDDSEVVDLEDEVLPGDEDGDLEPKRDQARV
jgi:twitching motility protein PilJ